MTGFIMPESCNNCGRTIGAMEKQCVIRGRTVCFDCDELLRRQASAAPAFQNGQMELSANVSQEQWAAAILLNSRSEHEHENGAAGHAIPTDRSKASAMSTVALVLSAIGVVVTPLLVWGFFFGVMAYADSKNTISRDRARLALLIPVGVFVLMLCVIVGIASLGWHRI